MNNLRSSQSDENNYECAFFYLKKLLVLRCQLGSTNTVKRKISTAEDAIRIIMEKNILEAKELLENKGTRFRFSRSSLF